MASDLVSSQNMQNIEWVLELRNVFQIEHSLKNRQSKILTGYRYSRVWGTVVVCLIIGYGWQPPMPPALKQFRRFIWARLLSLQ